MEQVKCILDELDAICQNNLDSNLLSKMLRLFLGPAPEVRLKDNFCANRSEVITQMYRQSFIFLLSHCQFQIRTKNL